MNAENYGLDDFQIKTRTEDTKTKYLNRAEQLIKRAKKELNIADNDNLDVRQLVIWLNEHKPNINAKSWRQYKSSVLYYLEQHSDQQAAIEAIEYLKDITSKGSATYTEKTSSLKLKKISFTDWQTLDKFLQNKNNKWYEELRHWLRASIITGLRPIEWKNAVLFKHNGEPALKIQNAKHTNGRGNGPTRTILLKYVSVDDLASIKTHLNNVRTFSGMDEYDFFYQGCSIALYKACRKCWPRRRKHITLYSTRHQFSANAKSSSLSRPEIAALMGHAVDETATAHYGRKQAGNEKIGVSPVDQEVKSVKRVTIDDFKKHIKDNEKGSGGKGQSGISNT
jgi:integrase